MRLILPPPLREDEADTVAYSGPHLAELIAASGENPVVQQPSLEAHEVETTVVITGGAPTSVAPPPPSPPRPQHSRHRQLSQRAVYPAPAAPSFGVPWWPIPVDGDTEGSLSQSVAPVVYSQAVPVAPQRPAVKRSHGIMMALAMAGIVFGLLMGTSIPGEATSPALAVTPHAEQHVRSSQVNPLVSPMHGKVMAKRVVIFRSFGGLAATVRPASVVSAPPVADAPAPASTSAEDQKLLRAAKLEQPL